MSMEIKVSKVVAQALGEAKMRAVGEEIRSQSYRDHYLVDLAALTQGQIEQLLKLGGLVQANRGHKQLGVDTIDFVAQFQPTKGRSGV